MNDQTYRYYLDLMMAAGPLHLLSRQTDVLLTFANEEASKRGYGDWIKAWHHFNPNTKEKPETKTPEFTCRDSDNLADIIWWIKGFVAGAEGNWENCPFTSEHEESLRRARVALDERIK